MASNHNPEAGKKNNNPKKSRNFRNTNWAVRKKNTAIQICLHF